jgi:osmotically-inducible protein OsmY
VPAEAKPNAPAAATAGSVEMTIDANGFATLRGKVATLSDRIQVGQEIARQPGVSGVLNLLEVEPTSPGAARPSRDIPPPPPTPADDPRNPHIDRVRPVAPSPANERAQGAIQLDQGDVNARLVRALEQRPALAGVPIRTEVVDGVATISGKAPSAFEAMLAFRAAQQTPGVRAVDDRLQFAVPAVGERNPLIEKGRPDDVEPYLEAQMRRQFRDQVHIDRVRVRGNTLEVRGTVSAVQDRPRVEATLRSMPILRGFRLDCQFAPV